MQTISNRIIEIKKQLDELEGHVNSTLSILDCKSFPLNKYPEDYHKFVWRNYSSYVGYTSHYATEDEALEAINTYRTVMEEIHNKNILLMQKNTETFNKICDFLIKLGFSKTNRVLSGSGKKRHSYLTDSEWVSHLKTQYIMLDKDYSLFIEWYNKEIREISSFFESKRVQEEKRQSEEDAKRIAMEEVHRKNMEQAMAFSLAVEFLKANGMIESKDFTNDNAIDLACKIKNGKANIADIKKESEVARPKTINALDRI